MTAKSIINAVSIGLLPLLVLASGYFLVTHSYLYSLFALLAIVVSMETRVRMGYRGQRGWMFASHIVASTILLVVLALLLRDNALLLQYLAYIAFCGMLLTGVALIRGSWNRVH